MDVCVVWQMERPGKVWYCAKAQCVSPHSTKARGGNTPTAPSGIRGLWPVKVGTKVTEAEVRVLGEEGINIAVEMHMIPEAAARAANTPGSETVETTRFGRKVQRKTVVSKGANAIYTVFMEKNDKGEMEVVSKDKTVYERKFEVMVGSPEELGQTVYKVVIGKFPQCSCDAFKKNETKKGYQACWHLYAVFATKVSTGFIVKPQPDFIICIICIYTSPEMYTMNGVIGNTYVYNGMRYRS